MRRLEEGWGWTCAALEEAAPVAHFIIRRPEVRNALSLEVLEALRSAVERLEARPDLAALVLRSEGEAAFAAGGDLRELAGLRGEEAGRAFSARVGETLERLAGLEQISIAAIEGDAYGGGVELALACDLRVMGSTSRLGLTQGRFGVTTGWGGGARLVALAGASRALEALLMQRVLDAPTCAAWGLANRVVPAGEAEAEALAWATWIGGLDRELRVGIKRVVEAGQRHRGGEAAAEEREIFARLWGGAAHEAQLAAFLKRERSGGG